MANLAVSPISITPLVCLVSCSVFLSRSAKVSVVTLKSSGLKMAVKSIARYTAADDSLVRKLNGVDAFSAKVSFPISRDSNMLQVSEKLKGKRRLISYDSLVNMRNGSKTSTYLDESFRLRRTRSSMLVQHSNLKA